MCTCKNVKIGSYDNQITLSVPENITIKMNSPDQEIKKRICIDKCLSFEIIDLWKNGIITTGCCCGHNKQDGYIGVLDEFIPGMKKLGYQVHFNHCRPEDEDSFIPKSLK